MASAIYWAASSVPHSGWVSVAWKSRHHQPDGSAVVEVLDDVVSVLREAVDVDAEVHSGEDFDGSIDHGSPRIRNGNSKEKAPGLRPGAFTPNWWRRRDSCSTPFGAGWTIPSSRLPGMRGVLSDIPDPSARPPAMPVGESMSLYRAGLKLAFFLPLGVATPSLARRFEVSPM